jgi:hypothetical protein
MKLVKWCTNWLYRYQRLGENKTLATRVCSGTLKFWPLLTSGRCSEGVISSCLTLSTNFIDTYCANATKKMFYKSVSMLEKKREAWPQKNHSRGLFKVEEMEWKKKFLRLIAPPLHTVHYRPLLSSLHQLSKFISNSLFCHISDFFACATKILCYAKKWWKLFRGFMNL